MPTVGNQWAERWHNEWLLLATTGPSSGKMYASLLPDMPSCMASETDGKRYGHRWQPMGSAAQPKIHTICAERGYRGKMYT